MIKRIRKYFVVGIITIIPVVFLLWVINLIYNPISNLIGSQGWVSALTSIGIILLVVFGVGFIFTHIKILKRLKKTIEVKVIDRLPIIKTVNKFYKILLKIH